MLFRSLIESLENVADFFKNKQTQDQKILLLVSSPKDALFLINSGVYVEALNVGGIHYVEEKVQILEFLSVDKNDCKYFHEIAEKHIKIEGRPLPSSEKVDILRGICRFETNKEE